MPHDGLGSEELLSAAKRAPRVWRSVSELEAEGGEFADGTLEAPDGVSRRTFMRVMAASAALANLQGCAKLPPEPIVPYSHDEPEVTPGVPMYFATAITRGGYARGVLVESHMGRPTKIEGNPDHPSSLGATDIFTQAAALEFYDPDRSQTVRHAGDISTWELFEAALRTRVGKLRARSGRGLAILSGTVTSPTTRRLLAGVLEEFPHGAWYFHEPIHLGRGRLGVRAASGVDADLQFRFDRARVIVSLDSNFLQDLPGSVRFARDWARTRRVPLGRASRLYVAEPTPTMTGARADARLRVRRSRVSVLVNELARRLEVLPGAVEASLAGEEAAWVEAAARDMSESLGEGIVIAGISQPAPVHALVLAINAKCRNLGATVRTTEPVEAGAKVQPRTLTELDGAMRAGEVTDLIVIGTNPVHDARELFDLNASRVEFSVHAGLYRDETGTQCEWHLPLAHELESWGDARGHDGTASIIQPLIMPLYEGRTANELLAALRGVPPTVSAYDLVRDTWRGYFRDGFERSWRSALRAGVVDGTASGEIEVSVGEPVACPVAEAGAIELAFTPDPTIWDGRYANNGWLQELPKPLTRITWDNAAYVSPSMAAELALRTGDVVVLEANGRQLEAPVWINPGQAEGVVSLSLGYGRSRAGRVGSNVGVNAYWLRRADEPWLARAVRLSRTVRRHVFASTQTHQRMEGREPIQVLETGGAPREPRVVHLTLYPPVASKGQQWGMTIDLAACVGCQACVVACQAENNIPVVGKEQVLKQREMAWIRVDRYYSGPAENPRMLHQPVPCMQCEDAPCELVCPVGATQHSADGLNDMVYNRCIGTRYCSNNCPYKVRRFNFLQFADNSTESLKLLRNPQVTVRARGIMEKCTYCVQRIRAAEITARKEGRPIRDGEVRTACQQVCPSEAITFGDVSDPSTRVSRLKGEPRNYALMEDLNTRPRTTYLADIRNLPAARDA